MIEWVIAYLLLFRCQACVHRSSICHSNSQSISDNKMVPRLCYLSERTYLPPICPCSIYSKTIFRNSFKNWPDLMEIVDACARSIRIGVFRARSLSIHLAIASWLWFSRRFVFFFFLFCLFRFSIGYSAFCGAHTNFVRSIYFLRSNSMSFIWRFLMQTSRAL